MATIKTQLVDGQRRIITKIIEGEQRVSCSCCEEGCCMYSAQGLLDGQYQASDLPDAVTINWEERFTGSISRSGSSYEGGGVTLEIIDGIWRLSDGEEEITVGACLIRGDGNLTQGNDLVEDQFADTYSIAFDFEAEDETIQESVTVTRQDLCLWTGLNSCGEPVLLFYFCEVGSSCFIWAIDFTTTVAGFEGLPCSGSQTFGVIKNGARNSPVGNYGDGTINQGVTVS